MTDKPDKRTQRQKFIDKAREIGCDEDETSSFFAGGKRPHFHIGDYGMSAFGGKTDISGSLVQ
jgi:hypothetical protein